MAFLELQPHVSFGLVSDQPVFLDLARDRYLTLAGAQACAFRRLGDGAHQLPECEMARLVATGLFRPASKPASILPAAAPPCHRSVVDDLERPRPRPLAALRAQILTMRMRRRLRAEPLHDIVAALRARRSGQSPVDEARCTALASDFLAARTILAGAPSCLPDSLALLEWLAARDQFPALIFGVKLHPFKAHCWVQAGGLLLSDSAERVAEFTPLLVVE